MAIADDYLRRDYVLITNRFRAVKFAEKNFDQYTKHPARGLDRLVLSLIEEVKDRKTGNSAFTDLIQFFTPRAHHPDDEQRLFKLVEGYAYSRNEKRGVDNLFALLLGKVEVAGHPFIIERLNLYLDLYDI